MSKEIIIIVPSRGRPDNAKRLIDSWEARTQGKSDLMFVLDEDDCHPYFQLANAPKVFFNVLLGPRKDLCEKTNIPIPELLKSNHKIFCSVGDDHLFLTPGWEDRIIEWQNEHKGICYCNDLLQYENLPTNVFIHRDIIEPLGYMAPPVLEHYFIDNYWKDLGLRLNNIKYFPDIIIEHKHWSNGKSQKDSTYADVEAKFRQDQITWDAYRQTELANDVKKIQLWQNKKLQEEV